MPPLAAHSTSTTGRRSLSVPGLDQLYLSIMNGLVMNESIVHVLFNKIVNITTP